MKIFHPTGILKGVVQLPTSKSISNRLILLKKLYFPALQIEDMSKANDTLLMQSLIESDAAELNVEDAGTVMRFLLAYLAATGKSATLKGSARMHQRPIKELVDALREVGGDIAYLGNEGFPPLAVGTTKFRDANLDMRDVLSSQYVSAMLMTLPALGTNSKIQFNPDMNSYSFVQMTLDIMEQLGLQLRIQNQSIQYLNKSEPPKSIKVEKDWSSFYYWFSMAVIAKEAELFFPGLEINGIQSERIWLEVFKHDLITVQQKEDGLFLKREAGEIVFESSNIDFKNHPDLAPSFILMFSCLAQECTFTGLESLNIKESERAKVIHSYLDQLGGSLIKDGGQWKLKPIDKAQINDSLFKTHKDHRMAMSLASLSMIGPVNLDDGKVVRKSYPSFWLEMQHLGFEIDTFA